MRHVVAALTAPSAAASNYYPLESDTTGDGGERIVVQAYEYLSATEASLALVK